MGCASGKVTASGNDGLAKTAEEVAKDGKQPDDASGTVSTYVFSNFCSKFWLFFANFERSVLGCIDAKLATC